MEILPNSETLKSQRKSSDQDVRKIDFDQRSQRIDKIKSEEEEDRIDDFLEEHTINDSKEVRELIRSTVQERKIFQKGFSIDDLNIEDINRFKKLSSLDKKEIGNQSFKSQALEVEEMVDSLKADGHSNYEILLKLLEAHKNGKVRLLNKKYSRFKKFFSLLAKNQFGSNDSKRIVEVINHSRFDFSSQEAFETVIFSIYEDNQISQKAKDRIQQKFKLFPIVTGDDLKENLKIKRHQFNLLKYKRQSVAESLSSLAIQTGTLKQQLEAQKEAILAERDLGKRLELEKQYDLLEEEFSKLKKEKEEQEVLSKKLNAQRITSTVSIRGASANLESDEIIITIPGSKTKVSIPKRHSSQGIAKAVNAYLVNEHLKPFGLQSYFFYQSDFDEGKYPYPESLDRNDLFLFQMGFASDKQILSKQDLQQFDRLFSKLMRPERYHSHLTTKENGKSRLQELELFKGRTLDRDRLVSRLLRLKAFGRIIPSDDFS